MSRLMTGLEEYNFERSKRAKKNKLTVRQREVLEKMNEGICLYHDYNSVSTWLGNLRHVALITWSSLVRAGLIYETLRHYPISTYAITDKGREAIK